jgi:hypothetical protein
MPRRLHRNLFAFDREETAAARRITSEDLAMCEGHLKEIER